MRLVSKFVRNVAATAVAGATLLAAGSAAAQSQSDELRFRATIYGWFPGLSGTTEFPSRSGGPSIDVNAKDILENLKMAFMGTLERPTGARCSGRIARGSVLALVGAPVILADGFIMIPLLMLYLSAIGPLNGFVRERPTCSRCRAVIERSFPRLVRA